MPMYDYYCERCDFHKEEVVKYELRDVQTCPGCGEHIQRYYFKAPSYGVLGKEGSPKSVAAMKNSFDKRFVKRDIDDVRHKFGKDFDDSLVGAAVARIKKGHAPK